MKIAAFMYAEGKLSVGFEEVTAQEANELLTSLGRQPAGGKASPFQPRVAPPTVAAAPAKGAVAGVAAAKAALPKPKAPAAAPAPATARAVPAKATTAVDAGEEGEEVPNLVNNAPVKAPPAARVVATAAVVAPKANGVNGAAKPMLPKPMQARAVAPTPPKAAVPAPAPEPEEEVVEAEGPEAAEGTGEEQEEELPTALVGAKKLSDVVNMLIDMGINEDEEIKAKCMEIKERVPVLSRIENLEERVTRTLEVIDRGGAAQ